MATTVLIVDDSSGFRQGARRLLESAGYEVVGEADNGKLAIEAARELAPDVMLLDVQLPDISGIDVSAQVTSARHAPQVVLVSTREASDYGPTLSGSGARGFLPKGELSAQRLAEVLESGPTS